MEYFGTELTNAGHYFWELQGDGIYRNRKRFEDCPFNPEALPYKEPGTGYRNGTVKFYNFCGFSIMAIEGSCKDTRPGSKSIFFIKANLTQEAMKEMILNLPIAKRMIEQMSFDVLW